MAEASTKADLSALQHRVADLELLNYRCAHDLKGRLSALAEYLKGLAAPAKNGRWEDFEGDLRRMSHLIETSQRMLDEVLIFAHLNRDAPPVPLSIHQLVRKAFQHSQAALPSRTWHLTITGDEFQVFGQETQLLSVFENLFENAGKSTFTSEEPINLEVDCRREAENLVVHVRDRGRGIPVKDHERIFEPFVRLDPNRPGTGLGLWIVQHMIHRHGGRVWIESPASGSGTIVSFTLPLFRG